ncbi:DUF4188 domain-containing protein [Alkalihalobacillus sp. AL-G]|uniref:DUF4188 domain-containing protein n=1 Tax=Alkalihalobacillus sp. AL-G TaxID=2926399 RepID=UPI00272ABCE0|nr:DUF4188 domain-containing protein [Alkalihalobacillus sp. AL-G]WLD92835.1 DUF4188 domain-containing protein [Alkalihalobacillus sp. AL-G]
MGKEIFTGRYTSEQEDDVVVFIIGMRVNKRWAIHKWLPVFTAMPPMIRELYTNKEHGFLSMEMFFGLRTTIMIQYWRSSEDLMAYAKGPTHLTAWNNFNKKIGNNDSVGIYHETYVVPKGNYECIYGNMPKFGLAKATGLKKITPAIKSARQRLKA